MGDEGVFAVNLDLPPKVLSPNVRAHWGAKARATSAYREMCAWDFTMAKPENWAPCPVVLDVEYRCSRNAEGYAARDIQNAIAAMKAAIDGLVDAQIAPNDSKKYLSWGSFDLITTKSAKGDGVSVTVRRA